MTYENDEKKITSEMIIDMLRHAGHVLHRLPENGGARARVLDLLDGESCSQKVLTEALGIQPGSASELLGKMEAEGLIVRTPLPSDRRGMRVSLTEKGLEQLNRQGASPADTWLSCFTDEEKAALAGYLKRLLDYWHESLLPPRPHRGERPFGPRPMPPHGFDGPHPRPDLGHRRRERYQPDGEFRPLDSRMPARPAGEGFRAPYAGEDGCIQNCRECPLGPQGKCVRRV